jgi:hypothetical protein
MNGIVKQITVVGLFMLAVTVGVNAQVSQQYRADIPFSFDANGRHYQAGEYVVGSLSQVSTPGAIAIRDLRSGNARVLGIISTQGDGNWNQPGRLNFVKEDGRYTLSQISTATFAMKMKVRKARSGELASGASSNGEIVAIDLKK